MQIEFRKTDTLCPYARSLRRNDHAVEQMVASIRRPHMQAIELDPARIVLRHVVDGAHLLTQNQHPRRNAEHAN